MIATFPLWRTTSNTTPYYVAYVASSTVASPRDAQHPETEVQQEEALHSESRHVIT